jgi:hypothetical protein
MSKQPSRKKTPGRRAKGDGGAGASFPLLTSAVAGYEKWARETLVGKAGPFAHESPERFAEGIIRYIERIRSRLAEGAVDHAILLSFRLGHYVDRMEDVVARNRARQNENITIGVMARIRQQERRREQAGKAGKKTAELHAKIKARAEELRGEETRSKARILAREFPLSAERIRKII